MLFKCAAYCSPILCNVILLNLHSHLPAPFDRAFGATPLFFMPDHDTPACIKHRFFIVLHDVNMLKYTLNKHTPPPPPHIWLFQSDMSTELRRFIRYVEYIFVVQHRVCLPSLLALVNVAVIRWNSVASWSMVIQPHMHERALNTVSGRASEMRLARDMCVCVNVLCGESNALLAI